MSEKLLYYIFLEELLKNCIRHICQLDIRWKVEEGTVATKQKRYSSRHSINLKSMRILS